MIRPSPTLPRVQTLSTLIVIPARLSSTRLPRKILADIAGEPMIVHVWRQAILSGCGGVLVACGDREIADAIEAVGGNAVLTDPAHPSGSDRIAEAVELFDPAGHFQTIVNVQGDEPLIDPANIRLAAYLAEFGPDTDMATLGSPIRSDGDMDVASVVKAVVRIAEGVSNGSRHGTAVDFVRTRPDASLLSGTEHEVLHHVGLYAYRRSALRKFVALPRSEREVDRSLEQMRALDNGMKITIGCVAHGAFGVDTAEDLERAREIITSRMVA